jgi:5-methylcytosine-specific restriction endonuclease McrA
MNNFKKVCDCGNNLTLVEFTRLFVEYCDSCFWHQSIQKECTHSDKKPFLIEVSGGKFQVRMYCPICKTLDSKIEKQSGHNLSKLYKTTMVNYRDYWNKIDEKERPGITELLTWIRSHKHENIKERYALYIRSDKWRQKRLFVIERDNNQCQICGAQGSEVHHLTYAHLEDEYLFELVLLCKECHDKEYHNNLTQ